MWPQLDYADTAEEAADRADALLLLTEWKQYTELDRDRWEVAGWSYRALGRRRVI